MRLTPQQTYNHARNAGFAPETAINVLGIAEAESGFDPFAIGRNYVSFSFGEAAALIQLRTGRKLMVGVNEDHRAEAQRLISSIDRGEHQWNDYWHPEVTNEMAFTPALSSVEMFRVSNGGRDFSQWSTWQAGSAQASAATYRAHRDALEAAYQASLQPTPTPAEPTEQQFVYGCVNAAEFRIRGWTRYQDLQEPDKAVFRYLSWAVDQP